MNPLTINPILTLAVAAWALAQIIKGVVIFVTEQKLDWERILGSGGMPSSHSAFVCACAAATGNLYGWSSALFAIAAVLAIVVMYDASHVRKAAGEQAYQIGQVVSGEAGVELV